MKLLGCCCGSKSDVWLGCCSSDCRSIISELVEARSSSPLSHGIPLLSTVDEEQSGSAWWPGLAKLLLKLLLLQAGGDSLLLLISLKFDNPKLGTSSRTQIFSPLIKVIWVTMESGSRVPSMLKDGSRGEGGLEKDQTDLFVIHYFWTVLTRADLFFDPCP